MIYLELIAKVSLLFPICIFLFRTKTGEKYRWVIFFYISFIILQQITFLLNKSIPESFQWVLMLFNPIQLIVLIFLFRNLLKSKLLSNIATTFFSLFLIFWIFKSIQSQDYDSSLRSSASLVTLIACLLYYYQEIKNVDSFFVYTKPEFWGVSGIFIYAAGTFFVFLFRQQSLDTDRAFFNQYVIIHAFLFIIRNLFISISFLLKSKKTHVLSTI